MNILIGGEAGQGLVTVGQLLAKSLVRSGYSIVVTQSYHSRIRGGHNTFAIRVGVDEVLAPKEAVDVLVAFNGRTVALHEKDLSSDGVVVVDRALAADGHVLVEVPFEALAPERFHNIAALGVVGTLLGLAEDLMATVMVDFFGKKKPDLVEKNRHALSAGVGWVANETISGRKLPPVTQVVRRLMMNGNEAIALGALSAGVRFCSFYPMTPSTSICLNLAAQAKRMGLIVEQAEDEIAAINMAIGASFAGAPSMVATSGGGFALMVEGVSLAAMTETPVVVVVAQRPGPATGLPTRTEQGDLELVLHAGHGEFPRAIFAPGTVEECFYLTRKAFDLAERYQGPVFLLTDQFLADSLRALSPLDVEQLEPVHGGAAAPHPLPYKRFAVTESGISPRILPGASDHLVVADSDEHTEDGHITEDLSVRRQMVEKRLRKGVAMGAEAIPPDMEGPQAPDLLLISWGSSKGAVQEAASHMRSRGEKVATLHFSQVWPLVPDQVMRSLEPAREVVSVEGNAFGQLARLLRRETGCEIKRKVLRYDGLPLTPEYILRALSRSQGHHGEDEDGYH
ncbi:MAG: 2-oxoacid:acceptor oxidoreductase subunit alpha [Thermodesulfobacteriota bacterium]|nr:2-oxoacid:acceptor oxidoreductase subunit alpha [Thermodesulfobacteriota bacterium]